MNHLSNRSSRSILTATIVLLLALSHLHAASIGINFTGRDNVNLTPNETAGFIPQNNWNNGSGANGDDQTADDNIYTVQLPGAIQTHRRQTTRMTGSN